MLTEFIVFPEKFRFVSLSGVPLANGTEIRFLFSRPLALPPAPPDDLITVNRVPVVNLWPTAAQGHPTLKIRDDSALYSPGFHFLLAFARRVS